MKMDFWEKTNYTDGVPETYTKQLREKKMCDFWVYMPFNRSCSVLAVVDVDNSLKMLVSVETACH